MRIVIAVSLTLLALFLGAMDALARGIGVKSFLLDAQGKLTTELGETRGELLDPAAFVRYRYHEGRVTAVPLDQPNNPDKVLWSANVKAIQQGRGPAWQLLPTLIVVLGEDTITGLDRTTGKTLYTTPSGNFTDSPASVRYQLEDNPPSLYMIDDRALREQLRRDRPNSHPPATLARFDLLTGKFLWKTSIITPAGLKLRPMGLDARGLIEGENDDEVFYFDPATGKATDQAALEKATTLPLPPKVTEPRLATTPEKIELLDAAGKTLWSRAEPGVKDAALITADTVIVPCVTERATTQVIAYDRKDGRERWRTTVPLGQFADTIQVRLAPAKQGYLVQLEWLVLD